MKKEIRKVAAIIDDSRFVTQVHWGGGTPNYLEIGQVKEIMQLFYDLFRFSGKPEIAMECHPAYLDKTYIDGLLELALTGLAWEYRILMKKFCQRFIAILLPAG